MKQYSFLSAFWRAPAFSKPFYIDVATQWRGIGFWFLTILLAFFWTIVLARASLAMTDYLATRAPTDLKDMPPITLTKGIVSSPVPQPYIMWRDGTKNLCVLDTTGATTLPADAGAILLITRSELIQQDSAGRIQRHSLADFPDGLYDQAWVLSWLNTARNLLLPAGVPLLTLLWLAGYLLMNLLFAVIGIGINSAYKGNVTFAGLYRIAAMASAGPILLLTIISAANVPQPPYFWLILRAITLLYLFIGVKAAAQATRPLNAFPVQFPGNASYPATQTPPPLPPQSPPPSDDPANLFP